MTKNSKSRLIRFLVAIMLSSIVATKASANDELYKVDGITVDVKADNAMEAQMQAMEQARRKALLTLVSRLSDEDNTTRFKDIADEDIEELIRDYEVTSQKNSAIRFMATLNFRFNESAVKQLLEQKTVVVSETIQSPMVIIPVEIGDTGNYQLWGEKSPWLRSWAKRGKMGVRTPIIVPMGDLKDIQSVSPQQAANHRIDSLQKIARRYGAGGSIVAALRVVQDANNPTLHLDLVKVTLTGEVTQTAIEPLKVKLPLTPQTYNEAITQAVASLEKMAKKQARQVNSTTTQRINATVPVNTLSQWIHVERTLLRIPQIKDIQLERISRQRAKVTLVFAGSIPALGSALGASGLGFQEMSNKQWLIQLNPIMYSRF